MILFLIVVVYVLAGAWLGLCVDEYEMGKPMPYGELPAIVSLREWRIVMIVVFVFGGVPIVLGNLVESWWRRRQQGFFHF